MIRQLSAILVSSFIAASVAVAGPVAQLKINAKKESNEYDKAKLTVKAGQKVKLTLTNPKGSSMDHNWVLVQPGKAEEVGTAAMSVTPEKGYIPESPAIIAHTKLIKPETTDSVEFTAPKEPGEYPYICTFPGHYITMKGILTVTK